MTVVVEDGVQQVDRLVTLLLGTAVKMMMVTKKFDCALCTQML